MSDRPGNHAFAAFDPADVDDAKRGRPDFDLSGYAAERGLEFFPGMTQLAAFGQALPRFKEYGFNLMRGALPGGEFGVLLHEAWEVETTGEGDNRRFVLPGPYYGVVHKGRGSATPLSFLPVVGHLFSRSGPDTGQVAFDADSAWVPTTVAGLHLPEATGVAPAFWIRHEERAGRSGEKLGDFGLPGHRLYSDEKPGEPPVSEELIARMIGGDLVSVFERWQTAGFFEVRFAYGTLVMRCNGFLRDPDELAQDACALRRHLAEVFMPDNGPRPFETELPPRREGTIDIPPDPEWQTGFAEFPERHGLVHEDPLEFHRAFPQLDHPGQAVAVMRGRDRRVVYYSDHYLGERQAIRGAVLARAAAGTEETPAGGVRVPDEKLGYDVRDGLVLVWSLETWGWQWATDDTFLARADSLGLYA